MKLSVHHPLLLVRSACQVGWGRSSEELHSASLASDQVRLS